MDDLITLGVEVQTTGGAQAAQGLNAFQKAATSAAGAADQLEDKVNALGAAQTKSAAPAKAMAGAVGGLGSAFKNNSGAIQNASFQLQDVLVQMEMGVPITRTLGQQLPQLLGGFGPLGAVIGLATGALLTFAPALFAAGEPVNDLAAGSLWILGHVTVADGEDPLPRFGLDIARQDAQDVPLVPFSEWKPHEDAMVAAMAAFMHKVAGTAKA